MPPERFPPDDPRERGRLDASRNKMFQRLIAMFFQIRHERCPASADSGRIIWITLALLMNIARGVFQMLGTELGNPVNTGVVGVS